MPPRRHSQGRSLRGRLFGRTAPGIQISRFCASGLDAVNLAAGKISQGADDIVISGGVESMSRVGLGMSGGAWFMDPFGQFPRLFHAAGRASRPISSPPIAASPATTSAPDAVESQKRAANAWEKGYFKNSVIPVKDQNGLTILAHDEHMRPGTDMQALASLNPSFQMPGEMGGFEAVGIQAHPEVERINYVHHAGNSSGIVDGAAAVLLGSKAGGETMGLKPRGRIKAFANIGSDPALDADRPRRRHRKAAEAHRHAAFRHRSL